MNVKYYWVRRAVEKVWFTIGHIESHNNMANLFTKRLLAGPLTALREFYMKTTEEHDNTGADRRNFSGNVSKGN